MVSLGMATGGVVTLLDLEEGLAYLDSRTSRTAVAGGVGSRTAR